MSHLVLLYYCFTDVADPGKEAELQRAWCQELGLKGRIIIAFEGINGTVSGLAEDAQGYMEKMAEHPLFKDTEFKVDEHSENAFKKLSVKVRDEIVTLGIPVYAVRKTGTHLSPKEFHERLADPSAVVLDIRNEYEFEMGRFRNAVRPPVDSFKEFPEWILANFGPDRNRTILTYCTGGIRCEKLTAWMVEEGFTNVYQLHGGIVTYAKDPKIRDMKFEGDCFVFDDRLSVPISEPVSHCEKCNTPSARYVNCSNADCNRLYFLCQSCEDNSGLACCDACQGVERTRQPNERLAPHLRSEGERLRHQRHRAKRRLAAQNLPDRNTLNS